MEREIYDQYQAQEALQSQAGEDQLKLYAPQMQEQMAQSQAVVIAQTDPLKIIENLKLLLEGKIRTPDGEIKRVREPVMNREGISRVLFLLGAIINDNTRFSHFKEQEINRILVKIADDITMDIGTRWREYDVKDRPMCDYIIDCMIIPSFAVLKRALEQNEKNWIGRIAFESINQNRLQQPKKEGILKKLKL